MSEATDFLGAGEAVIDGEQAWTPAHVGPRHRKLFSAWAKARARQALRQQRAEGVFEGAEYQESLALLDERVAAGAYNWDSPLAGEESMGSGCRAALAETPGRLKLVQLLLEDAHGPQPPEVVAAALARQPAEWAEALKRCLAIPDPNAPAPAPPTPAAATIPGRPEAAEAIWTRAAGLQTGTASPS